MIIKATFDTETATATIESQDDGVIQLHTAWLSTVVSADGYELHLRGLPDEPYDGDRVVAHTGERVIQLSPAPVLNVSDVRINDAAWDTLYSNRKGGVVVGGNYQLREFLPPE